MPETHLDTVISLRIAPGMIGFYTHVEITEIFCVRDDDHIARNVFSLLVAEEHFRMSPNTPEYLGGRIRLSSIEGMMFGIKRSIQPISFLLQAVEHYRNTGEWQASDQPLCVGAMMPVPPQFVPADSTESAPFNKILKNNFWSGSHVLEMMDTDKSALAFLFDRPSRLQDLSASITKILPINIASLSDRLGNIVIQLPVTILIASLARNRHTGDATVTVRWHPKASSRDLVATCEKVYDNVVTGYAATSVKSPEAALFVEDGLGMQRGILWDDANKLVLAATEPTAFINQIGMQMHLSDPEPRVFTLVDPDGTKKEVRVGLADITNNIVQSPHTDRGEEWTRRRVYREEANRLSSQRRFVQYRPNPSQRQASHDKALDDIVLLLTQYGKGGAWLWDPYLSANDILRTLFRCPFKNAPLRALTAAHEPPITSRPTPTFRSILRQTREWLQHLIGRAPSLPSFAERQHRVLTSCQSNFRGLNIEYRMKIGQAGWAFHDRFLIFPKTDSGPLAWSLGSSVNSLGRQHHILQQVDDARLVADAFEELWDELSKSEHLIWKIP